MSDGSSLLLPYEGPRFPRYYWAALGSYFGSMAVGTSLGYSSTALPDMKSKSSQLVLDSSSLESWFASLLALGALFGGIFAGQCIERIGRRWTLMLISIPFVLGWLFIAYATNFGLLFAGRALTGFSSGALTLTCPIYISETVPASRRGPMGSGFQLFVTIGVLLSYLVGNYLSWPWHAIYATAYPIGMLLIVGALYETPTWLSLKNRHEEAMAAYFFFRQTPPESEPIILKDNPSSKNCCSSLQSFKQRAILTPFLLCLACMFFQQFSGVNAILFYTVDIFRSAGSTINGNLATIIVGLIQCGATFVACIFTDRLGRKILLITSGTLMGASLLVLSTYHYVSSIKGHSFEQQFGWMPLACLAVYIAAFSIGYGPLPWLLMSELLPAQVKGAASGIATAFNWFCCFVVSKGYVTYQGAVGDSATFGTFGLICLISIIFVVWKLPETKGKSLQEIQRIFAPQEPSV